MTSSACAQAMGFGLFGLAALLPSGCGGSGSKPCETRFLPPSARGKPTGILTGRVTATGIPGQTEPQPVEGAVLLVHNFGSIPEFFHAFTDSAGFYSVELPTGEAEMSQFPSSNWNVDVEDRGFDVRSGPGVGFSSAQRVETVRSNRVTTANFQLTFIRPTGVIKGRVTDSQTGQPLYLASVLAFDTRELTSKPNINDGQNKVQTHLHFTLPGGPRPVFHVLTDANGFFAARARPARLLVQAAVGEHNYYQSAEQTVDVEAGDSVEVDFQLVPLACAAR